MTAVTKQKFLITSSDKAKAQEEIDRLLEDNWIIRSVTPRSVSTGGNYTTAHGGFGILFEKLFTEGDQDAK